MLPDNFRLIYTDDDEEDRLLFLEGINLLEESVDVFLFDNGLSLVHHLESLQDAQLPSSIVCDMKMHMIDGLEILRMLKKDARLKNIPFIIFTTSSSLRDREMVLAAGAEGFFTKPSTIEEMVQIIAEIIKVSRSFL